MIVKFIILMISFVQRMNIQQLKAVDLVISTHTVTEAAARLFVTQPQVSRLIAELEVELGLKLFLRRRGRLLPTNAGLQFNAKAKRVLTDLEGLPQIAQSIRLGGDENILNVVAPPHVAYSIIPQAFFLFSRRYPKIRFSLSILTRNEVGRWVADHNLGLGISILPVDVATARTVPFASMHTAVIVPKTHELSAKPFILAADLAKYPFIALSPSTPIGQRLNELFQKFGISLNIRAETAITIVACEMVACGLGVTIADPLAARSISGGRVELKPWDPGMEITIGFFYGSERDPSPLIEEFSKIVVDTMLEIEPRFISPLRGRNSLL
jgi:DNA-binding transcriptional LysR family regulator